MAKRLSVVALAIGLLLLPALHGCSGSGGAGARLILAGYTTPREAYGKAIIPAFQRYWKEKTGESVEFQESYQASGAQSRQVVGGFEADIVALSMEGDIDRIANAGLITHDWRARPNKAMVATSIVVIAVRRGNPHGIHDWPDLARPGLSVLTPNPRTSGGAQWNINAIYGAALRGFGGVAKDDQPAALGALRDILRNVTIMDKGARESIISFEKGAGDVAITYENEVLVGRMAGQSYESVVPPSTILIENPVALVDKNVDRHGVRQIAEAFVEFLWTAEVQRAYAKYGLRPVDKTVAEEVKDKFPAVEDLWTIQYLGGWKKVAESIFGPQGVYAQAVESK
jgi:sulfate transport system substrate-binding protein